MKYYILVRLIGTLTRKGGKLWLIAFGILAGFYKFRKLRAEALEQEYKAKIQRLQYKRMKSEQKYKPKH